MLGGYALRINVFAALLLIGAASAAALLAHVGIDLAGDVVLAHDTYDGLDHRSRSDICGAALILAVGALLRVVWLALDEARTGRATLRPAFEDVFGSGPLRFVGAVVALTLPVLLTMEFFDIIAAGGRVNDLSELWGGSAWLGIGITVPVGAVVALIVRWVAKLVLRSHRVLVTAIGKLLAALPPACARDGGGLWRPGPVQRLRRRSILSRRSGKRGPPLHAT